METTTDRIATEAELDALAEVARLRLTLARIQGYAEYRGTYAEPVIRDAFAKIVETAREALEG